MSDTSDGSMDGAEHPTASRAAADDLQYSAFEGATDDFGIGPAGTDPLIGADIGGVTIVRLIGQGGMGRVYEARQAKPSRPVAVKVIRPGVVSESHMRRFDHEAEILARLRHPGIAQIHTVGTYHISAGHLPFFVMEYIPDARTLVDYADHHRLSTHDRLQLFRKVCDAVAHGHARGVVHRDLKPSNILVDAAGQPKVIDFGVAKSTDADLALTTMRTDVGQLIGTLQYMSPEQFDGQSDEVDVRSDVYALGVVLYELLAGRPPYDIRRKAVIEAARVVKEEDPTPLSSLNRTLQRDVGVIAGKCLAKEPDGRYLNAAELGADVGRYLAGDPIHASPAGFVDGLLRLARRHKAAAVAVGAVAASLVAAVVGISLFAARAERQREAAAENAAIAEHNRNVSDLNRFQLLRDRGKTENAFALLDDIESRFKPADVPVEVRVTRAEADDAIAVFPGRSFAFSPDGSLLAISGALKQHAQDSRNPPREHAYIVDPIKGEQVACLEEPSGGCIDGTPRFSGDGSRVAFATSDRELTAVATVIETGMNPSSLVSKLSISRSALESWGSRGACIWDLATGSLCGSFENPIRSLMAPDILPSRSPAAVNPDAARAIFVEGLGTATCRLRIHTGDGVKHIVLQRSKEALAAATDPDAIFWWDFEPAFDRAVSRAAIPGADGQLCQLWDLDRATLIGTLDYQGWSEPVFSPDGKRLLLCWTVKAGDIESADRDELARRHGISSEVLAWYGEDKTAWSLFTLWDATTGQQLSSFGMPADVFTEDTEDFTARKPTFAFSPDSELLVITGKKNGSLAQQGGSFLEVRSGRNGQLISRAWLEKGHKQVPPISQVVFSPSGNALVICRQDGTAFPLECSADSDLKLISIHLHSNERAGDAACFSPDGAKLAFRLGKELRIYRRTEFAQGKPRFELWARLRGRHEIGQPTFSPDGARVAATLGERQIALWDVSRLEEGPFSDCPFSAGVQWSGFESSRTASGGRWCFDSPLLAFTGDLNLPFARGDRTVPPAPAISIYRVAGHGIVRSAGRFTEPCPPSQSLPRWLQQENHPPDGLLLDAASNNVVFAYGHKAADYPNKERGLPDYHSGAEFLLSPEQHTPKGNGTRHIGWRSTLTKHRFGVRVLSADSAATVAERAVNAVSPTGKYGLTWSPPELIELATGKSWAVPELCPEAGAVRVECSWSNDERFLAVAVNNAEDGELTIYACANQGTPQAVARRHCVGGIRLLQEGTVAPGFWPQCRFTFAAAGERILWRDDSGDRIFRSVSEFGRASKRRDSRGATHFFQLVNADLTRGVQCGEGSVSIWDLERESSLGTFPHAGAETGNAIGFDALAGCVFDGGRRKAIIYGLTPPVLWSAETPHVAAPAGTAHEALAAAINPDGTRIAVLGVNGTGEPRLFILDAETGESLGEWQLERDYDRVAFVNGGRHILTYGDHAKLWGLSHRESHIARTASEASAAVLPEVDAWIGLDGKEVAGAIQAATSGMNRQEQLAVRNAFLSRSAERELARQQRLLAAKRVRLEQVVDKVCPPVTEANRDWWGTWSSADDIENAIEEQLSIHRDSVPPEDRAELSRMTERRFEQYLESPL